MTTLTADELLKLKEFKFNNSKNCCLAPHSNINFDVLGEMRVCCYNNEYTLGEYPIVSIKEAWNGAKRQALLKSFETNAFPKGCQLCSRQVLENNKSNALFNNFNFTEKHLSDYPVVMEFEFATTCNYECIMCGGKWSSSIRKNREKLPPLISPYNEKFVEELKEFIPHLRTAKFLGGEPFANPIYYKIWELISDINPEIHVAITTNGSIFNEKVKSILMSLKNTAITISLDSLESTTYNFIRKNGNLDVVMRNISELLAIRKCNCIAFCPMIQNVYELPNIVKFCNERWFTLCINDVSGHLGGKLKGIHINEQTNDVPWIGNNETAQKLTVAVTHKAETLIPEVALNTLSVAELQQIFDYLKGFSFETTHHVWKANNNKYQGFLCKVQHLIQLKTNETTS